MTCVRVFLIVEAKEVRRHCLDRAVNINSDIKMGCGWLSGGGDRQEIRMWWVRDMAVWMVWIAGGVADRFGCRVFPYNSSGVMDKDCRD